MTAITIESLGCICGHADVVHDKDKRCVNNHCHCKKFTLNPKRKVILSITLSAITAHKFKNFVTLKHGFKKGALSFEVERALRQYMGEKDLDVFIDEKDWQEYNK
jgi:hypothetical protein